MQVGYPPWMPVDTFRDTAAQHEPPGTAKGRRMSHTTREKTKLISRVRRIRGQMEAIERALEDEKGCADVLQLIAGVRGAINGLMAEVVEDHILLHVADHTLAMPPTPRSSSRRYFPATVRPGRK